MHAGLGHAPAFISNELPDIWTLANRYRVIGTKQLLLKDFAGLLDCGWFSKKQSLCYNSITLDSSLNPKLCSPESVNDALLGSQTRDPLLSVQVVHKIQICPRWSFRGAPKAPICDNAIDPEICQPLLWNLSSF